MTKARALRIMLIINQLPVGGLERFVVWLADALRRSGHAVHLVCLNRGGPVAQEAHERGIPTTILGGSTRPSLSGAARFTGALARLARLVGAFAPDVVQTHLFGSQVAGGLTAALARVPALVHVEQNFYHWKGRVLGLFERALAGQRGALVTPTSVLAAHHRERLGLPAARVNVIPNGVPCAEGPCPQPRHLSSHLWAGVAERLVPAKRQNWLLQAAELACREEPRLRWLIIGDGPARATLERAAGRGALAGKVHFAGEVSDPLPLLAGLDMYATGSTMEGFGIAPIEALALGIPVLAPAVPVFCETLCESGGAMLVSPDAPVELAKRVVLLARRPRLRQALGRAGRQWARERCSVARMTSAYEALYQRLLADPIGQERH
jgi:glycosyltransferase involved in cell wall biosynthesis